MDLILGGAGLLMALVAGVFLSFSDFVMRGLAQAPGGAGALGMAGLNRTVYRSIFMTLLIGFVPASLLLSAVATMRLDGTALVLTLAGAALYLVGVMSVTGLGNVPMNRRLDRMAREGQGFGTYWPAYRRSWTWLNHLRVAAATMAAAAWIAAALLA